MCLMIRTIYKFNTVEAFERAVTTAERKWPTKLIRGRVTYNGDKQQLTWKNLRSELERAQSVDAVTITGIIAVENQ
jgi:hypothetical protein